VPAEQLTFAIVASAIGFIAIIDVLLSLI